MESEAAGRACKERDQENVQLTRAAATAWLARQEQVRCALRKTTRGRIIFQIAAGHWDSRAHFPTAAEKRIQHF
jgi:hypothetical protein